MYDNLWLQLKLDLFSWKHTPFSTMSPAAEKIPATVQRCRMKLSDVAKPLKFADYVSTIGSKDMSVLQTSMKAVMNEQHFFTAGTRRPKLTT